MLPLATDLTVGAVCFISSVFTASQSEQFLSLEREKETIMHSAERAMKLATTLNFEKQY